MFIPPSSRKTTHNVSMEVFQVLARMRNPLKETPGQVRNVFPEEIDKVPEPSLAVPKTFELELQEISEGRVNGKRLLKYQKPHTWLYVEPENLIPFKFSDTKVRLEWNEYSGWYLEIFGIAVYTLKGEWNSFGENKFEIFQVYTYESWPEEISLKYHEE